MFSEVYMYMYMICMDILSREMSMTVTVLFV